MEQFEQEQRGKRKQIVLYPEDEVRLTLLAKSNTGENESMMIRKLLELAFNQPRRFGLHAPKIES